MHEFQFFTDRVNLAAGVAYLVDDDFKHAVKVLRKKEGDQILLFDGKGMKYGAVIEDIRKNVAECRILFVEEEKVPDTPIVSVGFGVVKSGALTEIIRDATALGVRRFCPVAMKNSVVKSVNIQRLKRVAIESVKQSGGSIVPEILDVVRLEKWFEIVQDAELKLLAYQSAGVTLRNFLKDRSELNSVAIIFGPEGDFTHEEVKKAVDNGFVPVKLTNQRLRSNLAVVSAVAYIMYHFYREVES